MIKIVTDSTAYLPESYIDEHDIRVVPLNVHFGQEAFKEGVELGDEEFYARLKAAPELPTTSQPSAGQFLEVFEEIAAGGHEIVTLTISSKLSGTWNSAMAAKDMLPDAGISVVDTLSTAVGMHLMIDAALEAIASGASRSEVAGLLEGMKGKVSFHFVVDTLEYLAKGGRIGGARALLGTMLRIKPILTLVEGAIEPLEQVRSKRKAVARLLDLVGEELGDNAAQAKLGVCHAIVPEDGSAVRRELVARLGCEEPILSGLGPVIGTHTGPGCIAVAMYVP
jgi:DegV family protein with EDD domain